jgi:hypothetical protein
VDDRPLQARACRCPPGRGRPAGSQGDMAAPPSARTAPASPPKWLRGGFVHIACTTRNPMFLIDKCSLNETLQCSKQKPRTKTTWSLPDVIAKIPETSRLRESLCRKP